VILEILESEGRRNTPNWWEKVPSIPSFGLSIGTQEFRTIVEQIIEEWLFKYVGE
jgi:hypothetical protein